VVVIGVRPSRRFARNANGAVLVRGRAGSGTTSPRNKYGTHERRVHGQSSRTHRVAFKNDTEKRKRSPSVRLSRANTVEELETIEWARDRSKPDVAQSRAVYNDSRSRYKAVRPLVRRQVAYRCCYRPRA